MAKVFCMRIKIPIATHCKFKLLPSRVLMKKWITHCLSQFLKNAEVHVDFVDSKTMRQLNAQYRNKEYATNLLSFLEEVPLPAKQRFLGNIILCPTVIAKEALEQRKIFNDHLAHVLIHGCLHLLGYHHEKKKEAHYMETLEIKLLKQLGITNPYE